MARLCAALGSSIRPDEAVGLENTHSLRRGKGGFVYRFQAGDKLFISEGGNFTQ